MSKVVERVARAMALRDRGGDYWDSIPDGCSSCGEDGLFKGDYLAMAQAAIDALRDPTEAMIAASVAEAGRAPGDEWEIFEGTEWPKRIWQAMIDAASKEPTP